MQESARKNARFFGRSRYQYPSGVNVVRITRRIANVACENYIIAYLDSLDSACMCSPRAGHDARQVASKVMPARSKSFRWG
jgi:hypothetical protein